jgi:hypothetical protein
MRNNNRLFMHKNSGIVIKSRQGTGEATVALGGGNVNMSIEIDAQTKISLTARNKLELELGLDRALFLVSIEGWSKRTIRKSKETADA